MALAFVADGIGQVLGGGGLLAVFVAGVLLSNGRYRIGRFEQQALAQVMHPLNTAAEITVLLLFGLLVQPAVLITVLPLGLLLALVLPLARLLALLFVVVLSDLLLQTLLMRRLLPQMPATLPGESGAA
ncbi:MAG: cation:proton antiporter [Synechococcaceae cyanobacterium]